MSLDYYALWAYLYKAYILFQQLYFVNQFIVWKQAAARFPFNELFPTVDSLHIAYISTKDANIILSYVIFLKHKSCQISHKHENEREDR